MSTPSYRDDLVYRALEDLCIKAGVKIVYESVPNDSIDGKIWARAGCESMMIMMPDSDCFDSAERATLILGHELGHILTGVDSPDDVATRVRNEAICDLSGWLLHNLAEMIASEKLLQETFDL